MSYVKSRREVDEIEALFMAPRFLYEGLRVVFRSTADFVREVLPPGLEPADEPLGYVSIGRWQSAVCGEFDTGSVFLKARHEGLDGWYNLTMIVSGEMPVVWGREVWGEVKKHGRAAVHKDGDRYYAYAERNGVRLMEIDATLADRRTGVVDTSVALEIKAYPAASGAGLEYDPLLVKLECTASFNEVVGGKGTLTLRSSETDPVGTIPVAGIESVSFAEGETAYRLLGVQKLCGKEEYTPYFYGRHYDDFMKFPIAARYRARN